MAVSNIGLGGTGPAKLQYVIATGVSDIESAEQLWNYMYEGVPAYLRGR